MKIKLITTSACICVSILLCSSTCRKNEACGDDILFVNNSGSDVYVDRISKGYPDTNYYRYSMPNPALDSNVLKVYANQSNSNAFGFNSCYGIVLQNQETDTLMVYVFDAHVLETTLWDTVTANNLYLKRYDLSLQDLQNSNWRIVYP